MVRRPLSLVTSLALLISLLGLSLATATLSVPAPTSQPAKPGKLGPHDLDLLAAARANGESTVTLLIAATAGQNRNVANAITALGGSVRYSDDGPDYIRAKVATDVVEKVAAVPGIDAVDLDEIIPIDDPKPEGAAPLTPQTSPDATTPRANPYLPIQDTGAASLTAAHPTWDGRGVTIGMVDTGVSLDNPRLLTTSTGERKVIDWVTGTDPRDDNDPTWIDMSTHVSGATFTFGTPAVTYTTSVAGTYRFANLQRARHTFRRRARTDTNVLVGSGDVIISSVSP